MSDTYSLSDLSNFIIKRDDGLIVEEINIITNVSFNAIEVNIDFDTDIVNQ